MGFRDSSASTFPASIPQSPYTLPAQQLPTGKAAVSEHFLAQAATAQGMQPYQMEVQWSHQVGMAGHMPGTQAISSAFLGSQQFQGVSPQMNAGVVPVSLPYDPTTGMQLPNSMMGSTGGMFQVSGFSTFPSSSAIAMSISGFQEGLAPGQLSMGQDAGDMGGSFGVPMANMGATPEALSMSTLNTNPGVQMSSVLRQRTESWPAAINSLPGGASAGSLGLREGLTSQAGREASSFSVGSMPNIGSVNSFDVAPAQPPMGHLPRPASMPALMGGGPLMFDPGLAAQPPPKKKGRGGRTAAMDPRLDPNVDPKRAKRILANRLSAARSKNKQRGQLDGLENAKNLLTHQKQELLKEAAWLRAEVQTAEEEAAKLQAHLKALEEHSIFQEALQIKLLEECGHQPMVPQGNTKLDFSGRAS
mmetsp:Transcript_19171/g.53462  ORF Transcript_19171/g.53462 Transcript_19171/m.53462 type:complete len:418 (-) Transcript_19171:340-1593(-)